MALTRSIDEIVSGMPFEEIYSTVLSKSFILPGIADINIAEINTLEKSTIEKEIQELESKDTDESKDKLFIAQKKIEALNSSFY